MYDDKSFINMTKLRLPWNTVFCQYVN